MEELFERLIRYGENGRIPMHMPGHKRNFGGFSVENPYKIDITEIDGFDDYHHPEEILKESMERAASIYGTRKTYYLVNGSTCGVLAAISAVVPKGGKLLVARNCHKAVGHAVELLDIEPVYVYPQILHGMWINGAVSPESVEKSLSENPDAEGLILTSPTYEGVISDIAAIADILHRNNKILIVDEAHGAHLPFGEDFPMSAINCGADLVIQSLHKTLPCYTQTAVLHICTERVQEWKVQKYLGIYQTSSPSYIFMAGMERCICYMGETGRKKMKEYFGKLEELRRRLSEIPGIYLLSKNEAMQDYDPSKLVISVNGWNGGQIAEGFREKFNVEPEMVADDYVILMTSLCDNFEWYQVIVAAAEYMGKCGSELLEEQKQSVEYTRVCEAKVRIIPAKAAQMPREGVLLENSIGRISGQSVYVYPPGIPIVMPGEEITEESLSVIRRHRERGLVVKGLEGQNCEVIQCIK